MTTRKRLCIVCAERPAMKGVEPQCEMCAAAWVRMTSLRGLGPAPTISWAARRARAFANKRSRRHIDRVVRQFDAIAREWKARALAAEAKLAEKGES